MRRLLLLALGSAPGLWAQLPITITVQEALPIHLSNCTSGASCGVARSEDSFRAGIPFADDATTGITGTSSLGLTGCTSGQFRSLAAWPSGRIKWLEVQGTPTSLTAGGTTTCTLTGSGSGNFGGPNMATDNGSTITVATGTATYTIKKANFDLIDVGTVGATSVITTSSSASRDLVVMGPANPGTICGTCTMAFSSANDTSSTAAIEENGPVEVVIKATGALKDGSGNVYLRFTAREHFYRNRNGFKVHVSLQNADDSAGGAFATAYKGFASAYAQIDLRSGLGTMNYTFGGRWGNVGPTTFSGSENATLVQLYSNWMQDRSYGDPGEFDTPALPQNSTQTVIPRSSGGGCTDAYCYPDSTRVDEGYAIKDGNTVLESGNRSQVPQGWADTSNASGVGMMTGVSYLSAYWPKSIELQNGGTAVAVGIWPTEVSGFNWWICYTCYQISDFYFEPHATAPASFANDFLKYQYDLVGRAPISQYNAAGVFPWGAIPDSTSEDNYWTGMSSIFAGTGAAPNPSISSAKLCCANDSISAATTGPYTFRYYAFGATGGINESDVSESYLLNFITRGQTGKYVFGRLRERFIEESVFPRSDFAGGWRSKAYGTVLNAIGFPTGVFSANSSSALQTWAINAGGFEQHSHVYGMPSWYYSTGEEHYADTIKQGYYDWATNASVPEGGCSASCLNDLQYPSVPRAIGPKLVFAARIHDFAASIGDSTTANNAYSVAEQVLNKAVRPVLVSPKTSCTTTSCQGSGDYGTDRNRGLTSAMAMYQGWNQPQLQTIGTGNGVTTTFNFTLAGSPTPRYPIECGGPAVFPTVTITAGSVTGHDDIACAGAITGTGISSGSVNYTTGAGSVTFSAPPANGTNITAYFFYPVSATLAPNNTAGNARGSGVFQENLLINGMLEYANSRGPSWSGYEDLKDLAYGGSNNYIKNEMTAAGNPIWTNDGMYYGVIIDFCNDPQTTSTCHAEGPHNSWWANPATSAPVAGQQTVWWAWQHRNDYFGDRTWVADWQANLYQVLQSQSLAPNGMTEYGRPDLSALIYRALNPSLYPALNDMTITGFTDLGSGNYQVQWTVPANLQTPSGLSTPYKFKWGSRQIVPSMQFDSAETNTYGQSTSTRMPWFAATNVTDEPAPATPGTTQSYTFATATTGLTQANFSIKAYDTPNCSIAPAALGPWTNGQAINQTLVASNCGASTWAVSSGALPTGLALNASSGAISGTISASGTFSPTVTYSTASQPYTIVVNPAPTVTANSLPTATSTENYSASISISGGTGAVTCSADSGLSGSGLTVSSGCTVTGTVAAAGSYTVNVAPTDSIGVSGSAHAITITVNAAPTITTTSLANGTVGVPYNGTLATSGGTAPLVCSLSAGGLPTGLNLSGSCTISGTPSAAGSFGFTARVTDANSIAGTQSLSITVNSPAGPLRAPVAGGVCAGCRF